MPIVPQQLLPNHRTAVLEAYIPAENLSSSYVLDAEAIAHLLQLTQEILERQPQIKYLAWTVIENGSTPNFYFTQLGDRPITTLSVKKERRSSFVVTTTAINWYCRISWSSSGKSHRSKRFKFSPLYTPRQYFSDQGDRPPTFILSQAPRRNYYRNWR